MMLPTNLERWCCSAFATPVASTNATNMLCISRQALLAAVLEGRAKGPQGDVDCNCSRVNSSLVSGIASVVCVEQLLQLNIQKLKALNAALACVKQKCNWTKIYTTA